MLNEQDIKAAVIDKIRTRIFRDKAVLINEMVFGSNSRRADLVIANGHLLAFEIKSDLDTLRRLEGQVADYLSRFDKLILVVSSKFLSRALEVDDRVGIWEAFEEGSLVKLRVIRSGKIKIITSKDFLCEFLLKRELCDLIRNNTDNTKVGSPSRELLTSLSRGVPVSILREFVLRSIKLRYKDLSSTFLSSCLSAVQPADLEKLSRSKVNRKKLESLIVPFSKSSLSFEKREINLARFFPAGDIPENIPRFVLVPLSA